MALTWEHYRQQLRELLPRGRLWREPLAPKLSALLDALAKEFARVGERVEDALDEAFANTVSETIERWEYVYGLPDTGSLVARVARVVARSTKGRTSTHADYQRELAPILGVDADDVIVIQRTPADAIAAGHPDWVYWLHIHAPGATGSIADAYDQAQKIRHAHEKVDVFATDNFLCDDPESLCDRDLLGS